MRTDKYFIYSIIVALTIPIIISSIYLKVQYQKYTIIDSIAYIDSPIEIVSDNNIINTHLRYNKENEFTFSVNYQDGKIDNKKYTIKLNNIYSSRRCRITWTLSDSNYRDIIIKTGTFESSESPTEVTILDNKLINKNDVHNYIFKYKLSENTDDNISFNGEFKIQW